MSNLIKKFLTLKTKNINIIRQVQTNSGLLETCVDVRNNNPRNLELLRIARKPQGYLLDDPGTGISYWNKLLVKQTKRYVEAQIYHFKMGCVIKVSSLDWCINKFLYRPYDIAAYRNVGRILAERCLESGITQIHSNIDFKNSKRLSVLIQELTNSGLILSEAFTYKPSFPWSVKNTAKPWTM